MRFITLARLSERGRSLRNRFDELDVYAREPARYIEGGNQSI